MRSRRTRKGTARGRYSRSGFDDGLRDAARAGQDIKLTGLDDLYH